MHKLCLLTLALVIVALSSGQTVRLFSPALRAPRVRTINLSHLQSFQYPMASMSGLSMFPAPAGIGMLSRSRFNYPMVPDGEYRTAHGIATVDGSDVSMDSHF